MSNQKLLLLVVLLLHQSSSVFLSTLTTGGPSPPCGQTCPCPLAPPFLLPPASLSPVPTGASGKQSSEPNLPSATHPVSLRPAGAAGRSPWASPHQQGSRTMLGPLALLCALLFPGRSRLLPWCGVTLVRGELRLLSFSVSPLSPLQVAWQRSV